MLANDVARRIFELDELREHTWNPLLANPGRAIYALLARDFAPLPDRLASVAGRLAAVPAALAAARQLLGPMPRVHLETAITQFSGTITLVTEVVDAALRDAPGREARHRRGTPGRSGGAGRAPRVAVRTARRGRRRTTGSRTRGSAPICSPASCR